MDLNYFKKIRILDGGMGQELLSRGLDPQGTLWSAKALIEEKYHSLIENIHEDFINAGAEVIVTNTFTTRKARLKENKLEDKFEILNKLAGEIALKVKKKYPNILIAGGLPPQNITYSADTRDKNEIFNDFKDQAKILDPYVDFFYFDVLSSIKEISLATESIKEFNKTILIVAHISEIKSLGYPFGFKINSFEKTKISGGYTENYKKSKSGNPNEFLGKRNDLTPNVLKILAKKFIDNGATIIGGCCETKPSHIKAFSILK